jgi:hypothetical protein
MGLNQVIAVSSLVAWLYAAYRLTRAKSYRDGLVAMLPFAVMWVVGVLYSWLRSR